MANGFFSTRRAARKKTWALGCALAMFFGPAAAAGAQDLYSSGAPVFAGPGLPIDALYSAGTGLYDSAGNVHRMNFDLSFGPFIPIEGDEDFDVGWTTDMKFQAEVVKHLFLGAEFAYAWHEKHPSSSTNLFFDGSLHRLYFLAPIEFDIPMAGPPENPLSFRFGVAPGIQLVIPEVNSDVEDSFRIAFGLRPEEDDFVAFDLRFRMGFRFPVGPNFGFLFEVVYDWAEATAHTRFKDTSTGATVDPVSHKVDLSGVSVLFGTQWVF